MLRHDSLLRLLSSLDAARGLKPSLLSHWAVTMEQPRAPTAPTDHRNATHATVTSPRLTGISADALRVVASFVQTPALLMALPRDLQRSVKCVFDQRERVIGLFEVSVRGGRFFRTYVIRYKRRGGTKWRHNVAKTDDQIEAMFNWYLMHWAYAAGESTHDTNFESFEDPRNWYAFAPNMSIVRTFVESGVDLNVSRGGGCGFFHGGVCALHIAAVECHLELAQLLVAAGADVNQRVPLPDYRPYAGSLPLSFAMSRGAGTIKDFRGDAFRVARFLVEQGADVCAAQRDLLECARLYEENGHMWTSDLDDSEPTGLWAFRDIIRSARFREYDDPQERSRVLDDLDRLEAAMSRELAPERLWFTLPEGIAWTL